MKLHALAWIPLLALATQASANTQIVSYVETNGAAHSDPVVNFVSGQVAQQNAGGAINRAVTGIGTNKVFSSGNGTSELNAGSAWMDSYTVNGTGNVNVHLSFKIDGVSTVGANIGADSDGHPFDWTYRVVALKGGDWNLGGQGSTGSAGINLPIRSGGDNYESMMLTRQSPSDATVTNTYQPRFGGTSIWNVKNFGLEPGQFASGVARNGSNMTLYIISGANTLRRVYRTDRVLTYVNDSTVPSTTFYTSNPADANRALYNSLLTSYPILAQTGLCEVDDFGLCPGTESYDPTILNLDFTVAAGEQFTVLSYLSHINLRDGEFDFYNTATLSGITLSNAANNATLTSGSGALQQMDGGGYVYAPLALSVPEPAQWALIIGGFGLVGRKLRRRQRQALSAASIAVGAPRRS